MRRSTAVLAMCLGVTVACSQHAPSSPLLPTAPQSRMRSVQPDAGFKALYSFQTMPDGSTPFGVLLSSNGTFYGTTSKGGAHGFGSVYKVSTTGKERVIYSFAGPPTDGETPASGLTFNNGVFYGTTGTGGKYGYGTIFKVSATGVEHVLYNFKSMPDGQDPQAGLTALNGTFYGATQFGGAYGFGTIYKVSASGVEHVIYSFNANTSPVDGANPVGDLVLLNGSFYGTTLNGGNGNHGTVFKVSPSGAEKVIYRFNGSPDGASPYAGLINVNGTFYGTTWFDGTGSGGTVFKITPSGVEKVIYSFKGTPDGAQPTGRLIALNGTLYGTTESGGTSGNGTVFSVSTSGAEKILYIFPGAPNGGSRPVAGLTALSGALYGSSSLGGTSNIGTIFKLTP